MAIFHFVRQERKDRRLPLLANMFGTKKNYATRIGFDVLRSQLLAGKMLFCFVLLFAQVYVLQLLSPFQGLPV